MSEPSAPRRRRGCFFWGCLTVVVVGFVLVVLSGVGIYLLNRTVLEYTATEPREIPPSRIELGQMERLREAVRRFEAAAENDRPAELALDASDLNALIRRHDERLDRMLLVRFEDDGAFLDVSLPLAKLELGLYEDRYFNGTVQLVPELVDGELRLRQASAAVNDRQVPQWLVDGVVDALMEQVRTSDELAGLRDFARKARELEVREGRIVLRR